jgi:hypothetical protein
MILREVVLSFCKSKSRESRPYMRSRRFFAVILMLWLASPLLHAQTKIHVPADQPTIQAEINAANNGDTVLVAPGTYYENIDFKGKAITVTSSAGAASTIINGGQKTSTVVFTHGEVRTSILSNLTITGGQGYYDMAIGGIYISGSGPTILNNTITANQCYGINSQHSSPLIQRNEISFTYAQPFECTFAIGAGIWLLSSLSQPAYPVVIGNIIEDNTQSGLEDAGGNGGAGVAAWYGFAIIQNNIIRNNATGRYFSPGGGGEGGGIFMFEAGGLIFDNLIYGNTSNLDGGGVSLNGYATEGTTITMINNTIVDNAVVPVTTYSQTVNGGQQIFDNAQALANIYYNNIVSGSTVGASVVCYDQINPAVATYEK